MDHALLIFTVSKFDSNQILNTADYNILGVTSSKLYEKVYQKLNIFQEIQVLLGGLTRAQKDGQGLITKQQKRSGLPKLSEPITCG